ncbi:hypothetical protein [Phaeovulum sp. NW3]|uniref:hypothetical protein n=1 Tax=Phaeovulum sp. NW3 TaxID=2934933 RepID=UPI0020218317|nr:hypothetical protein [Phaeovulum sp. NW3]MCL7465124.1 hypothetical protein [Phaeovulum sp. NW3]
MHLKPLADELADIRAEIARLKRREAELRAAYLTQPDLPKVGRRMKVELVTQRSTIFDPRLLPAEIRNNPAYQREKVTRTLRTVALDRADTALPAVDTRGLRTRSLFRELLLQ